MSYSNDYKYGMTQEARILKTIKHFWNNPNIQKSSDKYSTYDFFDGQTYYELKSRKCSSKNYNTTMLPSGKLYSKCEQVFLFDFTDGLYYIRYNPDEFANFERRMFESEDRIGMKGNNREYVFIPINRLIRICEYKIDCLI
jgi:hypothetical protein